MFVITVVIFGEQEKNKNKKIKNDILYKKY